MNEKGISSLAHHWSLHHTHLGATTTSLLVEATGHLSSKVLEESEKQVLPRYPCAFYTFITWEL